MAAFSKSQAMTLFSPREKERQKCEEKFKLRPKKWA